ncbi:MAG: hypothetical protein U0Y82_08740 [Thermoleophilia bacterium]
MVQLLVDGWQIDHLHYADRCGLSGGGERPAAFIGLVRAEHREFLYVVDDGRAMSHRSLVMLFREHPHVWKHRTAPDVAAFSVPESPPAPPAQWSSGVREPFPESMVMCPTTLRGVLAVNQTQSMDGVTVAVTSIERFDDGCRAHYLCHAPQLTFASEAVALDAIVVDDAARMYRVAPLHQRLRGPRIEGSLAIGPALPQDTGQLTLTIGAIGPGVDGRQATGPWVFPVPLEPS